MKCPKCGHKVYSTVSEPEPVQQKLGDVKPKKESKPKTATQRLRAGEAVSGDDLLKEFNERDAKKPKEQPEKVVAGGGVAVFVKWQPNGDVKRGILVAYNKLGKPMVRIARVDSHGAYTGEVAAKARTFEPEDVVGAVDGRTLGVATHNANYRTEPVSSSQVGTVTTLAPTEEKVPEVVIDYTKPQYAGELTPGVAVADAPRETVRMRELREAREKRIGTPSPTFVVKQKENAPVVDGNWGDMQPNAIAIVEDEERAPWE